MCANKECRAWRAAGSPAVVAHKWNLRAGVKLPNASNKGQAQGSSAEASCYAALLEHIKTLRRIIIEHHSSTVMRDEVCVCPICAEKENATVLDESYKITAA